MESLFTLLNSIHPMSQGLQEYLVGILQEQSLEKKDFLLKAGHVCRQVCYVSRGLLRCFYTMGEADVSSWFMKEGDVIFSVESFLLQRPSHESIQALEDTHVYYIEYKELQHIYQHFPEFNFIGRVLTERYYVLSEQRVHSMRMHRSMERYDYLMAHHPDLIQRVPAKYLATYLGLTEVTLSKVKGGSGGYFRR